MTHDTQLRIGGWVLIAVALSLGFWVVSHSPPSDLMDALSRGEGAWAFKREMYYVMLAVSAGIGGLGAWCLALGYKDEE